ncbi:hypothetical protein BJG92_00923 [Arthrobacter sp. SO5]|nr:hypothetical protein [Arthrobacter sp. SO5]
MRSTVLPAATFWPGAGFVVMTIPAGTVGLLAMVVPGAPVRPFWRRISRAAASVRPGRSAGIVTTAGPSEMLRVMFEFGSTELPAEGTVPIALPLVIVSSCIRFSCGLSAEL